MKGHWRVAVPPCHACAGRPDAAATDIHAQPVTRRGAAHVMPPGRPPAKVPPGTGK